MHGIVFDTDVVLLSNILLTIRQCKKYYKSSLKIVSFTSCSVQYVPEHTFKVMNNVYLLYAVRYCIVVIFFSEKKEINA